ncbi:hypothetical protein ACFXJ8_39365 [Nonomuraea sp. NPDC059194]|uniref:hypothetical protein n=1 Tax=Nonomuraea sp. NPDC059194 TaxID=3346764 RepID=UPI0036AF9DFB
MNTSDAFRRYTDALDVIADMQFEQAPADLDADKLAAAVADSFQTVLEQAAADWPDRMRDLIADIITRRAFGEVDDKLGPFSDGFEMALRAFDERDKQGAPDHFFTRIGRLCQLLERRLSGSPAGS